VKYIKTFEALERACTLQNTMKIALSKDQKLDWESLDRTQIEGLPLPRRNSEK